MKRNGENEFIDLIHKEVKVQCSKAKGRTLGQYFIQLPKEVVRELEIQKGEIITIDVPLKDKNKYSIKLKRVIK